MPRSPVDSQIWQIQRPLGIWDFLGEAFLEFADHVYGLPFIEHEVGYMSIV
jgi:hypothetical protein